MLASYLESIKYVGHMFPVAFVRIVLGYQYLSLVIQRVQSGYLEHAYISDRFKLSLEAEPVSGIYYELLKNIVQPYWLMATYVLIMLEVVIGVSYILGFGVRVASLLGMILSMHIYLYFDFVSSPGEFYVFYIHLLFFMLGAGRCLGLDYYFYKSRRGLLW